METARKFLLHNLSCNIASKEKRRGEKHIQNKKQRIPERIRCLKILPNCLLLSVFPLAARLQFCQYKDIINRLDCSLKVLVCNTNNDIQFGRSLINHSDIDIGMRQC